MDGVMLLWFNSCTPVASVTFIAEPTQIRVQDLFRVYFSFVMGRMYRQANSKEVTFCILYPDC